MPPFKKIHEALDSDEPQAFEAISDTDLFNYQDKTYGNVFLHACRRCQLSVVKEIISRLEVNQKKYDLFIDADDALGRSAFALASIADNAELIRYLYQTLGFKLDHRDKKGYSALSFAIKNDAKAAFHELLCLAATFTTKEVEILNQHENFQKYFNSPECLLKIAQSGNLSALKVLLRHIKTQSAEQQRTFVEHLDQYARDALLIAAELNHSEAFLRELLTLPFNLKHTNQKGYRVLYYLIEHQRMSLVLEVFPTYDHFLAEEIASLERNKANFPHKTLTERNRTSKIFSRSCGGDQAGRATRMQSSQEILRPARSFAQERERQLLRHIGTQLYFYLQSKNVPHLVEIQVMHLSFQKKHFLFIAANEFTATQSFATLLKDSAQLETALVSTYQPDKDLEGKARSARYAKKFRTRVFDLETSFSPDTEAQAVAELLRSAPTSLLSLKNDLKQDSELVANKLQEKSCGIFFVTVQNFSYERRHAEEFLVDIAEYAKARFDKVRTCIAGKKRPCLTCTGRMTGVIDDYGKRPGRFWVHAIEHQSPTTALRTYSILCQSASYVTQAKNGTSAKDYDSASDTEEENDAIFPELLNIDHQKRVLFQREPYLSLLQDEVVSIDELDQYDYEDLRGLADYDIQTPITERDLTIDDLITLYQEDPFHLVCLTCEDLTDLVLNTAPDVNKVLMGYAEEVDFNWVSKQLCESEQMLFDMNLENYYRSIAPHYIG